MERLSSVESLQQSLYMMEVVSCGNVTDKGLISLHRLRSVLNVHFLLNLFLNLDFFSQPCYPFRNLEYLFLSDLPGVKDKQMTVDRLQRALPRLDIELDLD